MTLTLTGLYFLHGQQRAAHNGARGRAEGKQMSTEQIIYRLDQSIADHRDAGNGDIAHDLCCARARIASGAAVLTLKPVKLPNGRGMALYDNGVWLASVLA